jgi:hypothetical protein
MARPPFAGTTAPSLGATVEVGGFWSADCPLVSADCGGDVWGSGQAPISGWAATSDPHVYTFTAVVDVEVPKNGGDPPSQPHEVQLRQDTTNSWAPSHVAPQEQGDTEDGWQLFHLVVSFDCSSWQ